MTNAPNPALERFTTLIGSWRTEARIDGEVMATGTTTFSWSADGPFLVSQTVGEHTAEPWVGHAPESSATITGADGDQDRCITLYSDARGVVRIYASDLADGVWTQAREQPGFNQRFVGELAADGDTIDGAWEMSEDGAEWSRDFELVYARIA